MKTLKERIADVSSYLQCLTDPNVFPESKDKDSLIKACRRAKVPEVYISVLVSLLLTIGPAQKWPHFL